MTGIAIGLGLSKLFDRFVSRASLRVMIVAVMTLGAIPAAAQNNVAAADAPATITTRTTATPDAQIRDRIRGIFGEITTLRRIQISVASGVVTLKGKVPATADIGRAEAIASRVAGVVTVENQLTRDLAVDTNLSPALGNFGSDIGAILHALPLVGVALCLAALIAIIGYVIAGFERFWRIVTPNAFLAELVATAIRFIFIIFGLVAALEILGATALLGAVLGGAGVIGIALGFAVRDTVDNYVSSLMLSLRQPFRANDHVVIESSEGRVVRLTSRATILMTLDGNHLRIPNSTVFKAVILNYTRNPQRRFQFDLGIDADDNPLDGMAVGLAAVDALVFVLDLPKATAIIQDVGDSNILLRFFGWLDQSETDFLKGRSLAIQAAKSALEAGGFALPEPIYRLRFDEATPLGLRTLQPKPSRRNAKLPGPTPNMATQDTAPDRHIADLVNDERAEGAGQDLLSDKSPID
ncbi:MAG: mechanosensitive ion channel domain-containing protein [Sphingomonas sp.]